MSQWIVEVRYRSRGVLSVEAGDYAEAAHKAQEAAERVAPPGFTTMVEIVRQDGEPWVHFDGACKGAYPTVFVCRRATGHAFTREEVALLACRVEALGYGIGDTWNGEGCGSLSIGCNDAIPWEARPRRESMVRRLEVITAALEAPRPPAVAEAEITRDHVAARAYNEKRRAP